jgi:hypothetical protein
VDKGSVDESKKSRKSKNEEIRSPEKEKDRDDSFSLKKAESQQNVEEVSETELEIAIDDGAGDDDLNKLFCCKSQEKILGLKVGFLYV